MESAHERRVDVRYRHGKRRRGWGKWRCDSERKVQRSSEGEKNRESLREGEVPHPIDSTFVDKCAPQIRCQTA